MQEQRRRCMILPSGRGGCDSQVTAVAHRLGMIPSTEPNRTKDLEVDLVMTTGPERADEALVLGSRLGVPVVGFGQPGSAADRMDLVVTTPQFHVEGGNVLRMDHAISPHGDVIDFVPGCDADLVSHLPSPLSLVLVGGPAGPWHLDVDRVVDVVESLSGQGASVVVLTSARTPGLARSVLARLERPNIVIDRIAGVPIRMAVAMSLCSAAYVTGDSVSMISEVAAAGRPVAVIVPPASPTDVERYLADAAADPRHCAMPGDLRRFWSVLGGDLATPRIRLYGRASLDLASEAVERLLATRIRAAA